MKSMQAKEFISRPCQRKQNQKQGLCLRSLTALITIEVCLQPDMEKDVMFPRSNCGKKTPLYTYAKSQLPFLMVLIHLIYLLGGWFARLNEFLKKLVDILTQTFRNLQNFMQTWIAYSIRKS